MKARVIVAIVALFVSIGAYAQPLDLRRAKPRLSPEEWAAKRTERKMQKAHMSKAERKAYKRAHRERRQAHLNAMTPEKRARFMERRRQRWEGR
jgi:hypothetical protein